MPLRRTSCEQGGQVGTLHAGAATQLSAASSELCYFTVPFFSSEWFLFKFQNFKASPALFFFIPALHGYAFGAE